MIRRLLLGTGAAALAMGATTGAWMGTASATPPPVDMSGTITCGVTGYLHFSAPLTNGGTTQTAVSLAATFTHCTGTGATTDGVTVSGGALSTMPVSTIANNCGAVLSGSSSLPKFRGTVNWTATGGTAVPTKLKLVHSSVYDNLGTARLVVGLPVTLKSGSYAQAGTTGTFAGLNSNSTDTSLTSLCATGGAGLQTIAFGNPGGSPSGTVTFQAGA